MPDFESEWKKVKEARDWEAALRLVKPLAEQGHAEAQFNLGYMYTLGNGVAQDDEEALKWYLLAAEQGSEEAIKYRDIAESKMTTEQITKAYQLAHDYIDEKPLDLGDINDPAPWLGDIDNN